MEVEFADEDLDRLETDAQFSAGWDQAIVKGFRRRIQNIRAAVDERDLYAVKGNRFEKLEGNRKGQHSLVLTGNYRLIVKLVKESKNPKDQIKAPAEKTDEQTDSSSKSTKVRIIEIVDYH